jgi:hypothetical protein
VKPTSWSSGLSFAADGVGVVAHAGSVGLRLLAERTGLTAELSRAMVRRSFVPVHDRGQVLRDVAVMLADGGEAIADIGVLRHQGGVLGPVASPPTVWRAPWTRSHRHGRRRSPPRGLGSGDVSGL